MLFAGIVLPTFQVTAQDTTSRHGTVRITKKYTEADHWPNLAGVYNGNITRAQFCSKKGIQTNYPYTVVSFVLKTSYIGDKVLRAKGNALSTEMCKLVSVLPVGAIVHLEDIYAIAPEGQRIRLNSLRFTIIGPSPIPKK